MNKLNEKSTYLLRLAPVKVCARVGVVPRGYFKLSRYFSPAQQQILFKIYNNL